MGRGTSKISYSAGSLAALTKGLHVEGDPGAYEKEATKVIQGVKDVLDDFGMEDGIRGIRYSDKAIMGGDQNASMNGIGDLTISPKYLSSGEKNSDGYVVSDTFYGTGAHEAGHAVINGLLRKVPIEGDAKSENLKIAAARSKGKLEHEILKEAKKRYGSNPPISKYGSTKEVEKIAEAVSDVYSNKDKANPYSKVIVGVMKDINSGTFNPKLKVSRREMGI